MQKAFYDIVHNAPLVTALFSWFVAQLIKFTIEIIRYRKIDFEKLFSSGGMPSSHSAFVTALTTAIAFEHGFSSTYFAISCVLSLVVMYDAVGVRHETGKQATVINNLVDDLLDKKPDYFPEKLKELVGHTPHQVVCGAILGVVISSIFINLI